MTTTNADHKPGQPLGLASSEGLGRMAPERATVRLTLALAVATIGVKRRA